MALSEKISVEVDIRGKDNLSPVIDAQKRKAQELAQQQAQQRAATGDANARPPAPPPTVTAPPVRETTTEPQDTRRVEPALRPTTTEPPRQLEPPRPVDVPTPPPAPRATPARSVPVPFQSDAVREARNKARAEAQGLPYQSERVARLRDEARAAAQEKTAKENDRAVDAEKKLADARIRSGKAAVQLIPGLGQIASGFEGLQQTIQDMAGGNRDAAKPGGGVGIGTRAIGLGGVALAGAVGGGIASGLGRGAVERLEGGRNATEVAGAASGALGGAAAGALAGSILPGVGTAVGAVVGGVAGIFSSLIGGADRAKKAAEDFEAVWREVEARWTERSRRRLDFEGRSDDIRSGGSVTRGDLEGVLSPFALETLTRTRREDRTDVLRRELGGARRRDLYEGTTESAFRVEALEAAIARGVDGVTRRDTSSLRTGFGEAMSVSDAIFEAMAARSPAVEAADRTTEETRAVRESVEAMRVEMREWLRTMAPGV